jgi:ketosteroid isomerase-like protein
VSVDAIRSAFETFREGDVEPLVALIDPSMEWRRQAPPDPLLAAASLLTRPR